MRLVDTGDSTEIVDLANGVHDVDGEGSDVFLFDAVRWNDTVAVTVALLQDGFLVMKVGERQGAVVRALEVMKDTPGSGQHAGAVASSVLRSSRLSSSSWRLTAL